MAYGFKIAFLDIGFNDIIDIILVGLLFFQVYRLLKGSLAFHIFTGLIIIYLVSFIVNVLQMNMLSNILEKFIGSGFILLLIVFQQEVRRFLFFIGKTSNLKKGSIWSNLFGKSDPQQAHLFLLRDSICKAAANMSATQTGALIVFVDSNERGFFSNTGVPINGEISSKLIESIFNHNSPLHDGALLISEEKIFAASCVLPISQNPDLPTRVGMRHKAAVGITEQINAEVLIISEQTGKISWANKQKLQLDITLITLNDLVLKALQKNN